MMKKIVSLLLAGILSVSCMSTAVLAEENSVSYLENRREILMPENAPSVQIGDDSIEVTITDLDMIEEYIRLNDIVVPEGAELVEIVYHQDTENNNEIIESVPEEIYDNKRKAIVLRNIVTRPTSNNYIISGEQEYDRLYNYSNNVTDSYSTTYKQPKSSSFSANASVGNNTVGAGVGFTIGFAEEKTKSFNTSIPPRTKIEVKVQMNYLMKDFDIYDTGIFGTSNTYIGHGTAWRPAGLIVEKYQYNI